MRLDHRASLAASRERVWAVLMDVPRAARCLPGLGALEAAGTDRYKGTLRVAVGPVRLELAGEVLIERRDGEAGTATMLLDAAEARLGGKVRARLDLRVEARGPAECEVHVATDAQVLGRLGELGQALMRRRADGLVAELLACVGREAVA